MNRSADPHQIQFTLLVKVDQIIVELLNQLVNMLFSSSIFPDLLKSLWFNLYTYKGPIG